MKRLLALIIAIIMICSLCACASHKSEQGSDTKTDAQNTATSDEANNEPPKESVVTPLLYKVTDKDGNYVWLFGSIHVGTDNFYPLPDYVISAYNNADALAVECDTTTFENDIDAQTEAIMPMLYLDGTKISDHVSDEVYEVGVEAMTEFGIYTQIMDFYKPIMWYSMIESAMTLQTGADSELGIDYFFLDNAHDTKKEIIEIESVIFQYQMLANYSEELQALLLEDILYTYQEERVQFKEEILKLMDIWARGDEKEFSDYLSDDAEYESTEYQELYDEFNTAMITERNLNMADFVEETLKTGKVVFICVGSAHVVGDGAMADLLAQRGYTVEIVR